MNRETYNYLFILLNGVFRTETVMRARALGEGVLLARMQEEKLDIVYKVLGNLEKACETGEEEQVSKGVEELLAVDFTDPSSLKAVAERIPGIMEKYPNQCVKLMEILSKVPNLEGRAKAKTLSVLMEVLNKDDELRNKYFDLIFNELNGNHWRVMRKVHKKVVLERPFEIIEKYLTIFKEQSLKPSEKMNYYTKSSFRATCEILQKRVRDLGIKTLNEFWDFAQKIIDNTKAEITIDTIRYLPNKLKLLEKLPSPTMETDIILKLIGIVDALDTDKANKSCSDIISEAGSNPVALVTLVVTKAKSILKNVKNENDIAWIAALLISICRYTRVSNKHNSIVGAIYVLYCAIGRYIRDNDTLNHGCMCLLDSLVRNTHLIAPGIIFREYGVVPSWDGWMLNVANKMFDSIQELTAKNEDGLSIVSPLKAENFLDILDILCTSCREVQGLNGALEQEKEQKTPIMVNADKLKLLAKYTYQFIVGKKAETFLETTNEEMTVEYNQEKYGSKDTFESIKRVLMALVGENPHIIEVRRFAKEKNQQEQKKHPFKNNTKMNPPNAKRSPTVNFKSNRAYKKQSHE